MRMRSSLITFAVLALGVTNGRVFYLQNVEDSRDLVNPTIPLIESREQSSRDLDLSFAAGDSVGRENESTVQAAKKKVYALVAAAASTPERPVSFYKLAELSAKRNGREDIIIEPEKSPKELKISGGKGDVIVELRVIANHDDA